MKSGTQVRRVVAAGSFGGRLKQLRKCLGLTLMAVGQSAGVSESMVSHYEHDRRDPHRDTLWAICKYLGDMSNCDPVSIANFLKGDLRSLRISPIIATKSV